MQLLIDHKQKYIQKDGERTCLVVSFANLLHFCNSAQHANKLFTQRFQFCDKIGVWQELNRFLNILSPQLHTKKIGVDYNQLLSEFYDFPICTGLEGSDGKRDHMVTIYKGMIFDGNFDHPIHLSKEALSLCCSDENDQCDFIKFHSTYLFFAFAKYLDVVTKEVENDILEKKRRRNELKQTKKKQKLQDNKTENVKPDDEENQCCMFKNAKQHQKRRGLRKSKKFVRPLIWMFKFNNNT